MRTALNYLRYLIFLVVLIALFLSIDIGMYFFTLWGVNKIVWVFTWAWWKILLLGMFVIIFVRILWKIFRYISGILISFASYISPYTIANSWTGVLLSVFNGIFLIGGTWLGMEWSMPQFLINLICTILILQLTWAFYIGSITPIIVEADIRRTENY